MAALLLGGAVLLLAGCGGAPRRAIPPAYSTEAGAAALAAYDADTDGALSGAELDGVPALRAALEQVDTNGDQRLTAEEINARVNAWRNSRIAEMPVRCEVMLNGQPLANAQVVFEPEPFLGSTVKPASGASSESGTAGMSLAKDHLADPKYAGVACGWYKIRVTSSEQSLPACYNSQTALGCEVAMNAHWVNQGAVEIELKSP